MHVRVILPEDLCNRSPGFCALVIREETPSPLPVGGLTDGHPELPQEHCVVVALSYRLILLLPAGGGPALSGIPFRLGVPHQTCVLDPLVEVNAPRDPCPDLSALADAQRLHKNDVDKKGGSLGVKTPYKNPPSFRSQDSRELAPPLHRRVWHTSSLTEQRAGANYAATQRRPLLPRTGVTHRCDAGSLYRIPATTGAHLQGQIPGSICFPLGGVASPPT